jgi:high-affinity iron transporter
MFANFLIGLREGLEAALVVGILVAYVVRTGRRDLLPSVWTGVGGAAVISLAFGALLTFGPRHLTSAAQDAIGGTLSVAAVALVTWMIFWMARTARFLKSNLHHGLDTAIEAGRTAVVVMALLAVGREGLETALFLWAGATSTGTSTSPLLGAILGLAVAITLGWLVYRGAVRLNLRVFFAWTGLFLVVVAAGVLAYGVHDLQEAGFLPGEGALAFDVSAAFPATAWYATLLKGVFNFTPATTWLQLVAWVAYLVPTGFVFIRSTWGAPARAPKPAPLPAGIPA